MLRLLLDEHISTGVATGFRKRNKDVLIFALADFENGRLLSYADDELLKEAFRLNLTLVTYDLRTIPPLLKEWAEQVRSHAGVIFIDDKTIPPSNFGAIIRSLLKLAGTHALLPWENRVIFLTR